MFSCCVAALRAILPPEHTCRYAMLVSSTFPLVDLASRPQGLEAFFLADGGWAHSSLVFYGLWGAPRMRKSLRTKKNFECRASNAVPDSGVKDFLQRGEPYWEICPLKTLA